MLLSKSCESKYHIKNGTIKLGTLYEYRTIENAALVDQEEGMLQFQFNVSGSIEVPLKWYNTVFSGGMMLGGVPSEPILGKYHIEVVEQTIQMVSEDSVIVTDSRVDMLREAYNRFIFCMSKVRRMRDCYGLFDGCDDYWYLRETGAHEFRTRISRMLLAHIREQREMGVYIVPADIPLDQVRIVSSYQEVDYVSRQIDLYAGNLYVLERFFDRTDNMEFIKPLDYQREREFRFSFVLERHGKIIEPQVKSVLLDSTQLMDLIF
ncbi:hypothetical protein D3C76_904470 [compost metagenome]